MRLHYLQHVAGEDIGNMRSWFEGRGWSISHTRMDLGQPLPLLDQFDWLVVMGGPMSAYDEARLPWLTTEKAFIGSAISAGRTVIGICLGAQLLANVLGARVYRAAELEIGWFPVRKCLALANDARARWFPECGHYLSWHGDTFELPQGAQLLGGSEVTAHQGFLYADNVVALQFHLEADAQTPRTFLEAGGETLHAPTRTIQPWEQLQGHAELYEHSRKVMHRLLDYLADSRG